MMDEIRIVMFATEVGIQDKDIMDRTFYIREHTGVDHHLVRLSRCRLKPFVGVVLQSSNYVAIAIKGTFVRQLD